MYVSNIIKQSIVDGKGMRSVLFLQGCPHLCEGCHNPATHKIGAGNEMTVEKVYEELIWSNPDYILLDGITISGGEPFIQAKELSCLIKMIKEYHPKLNIWVYTGYTLDQLKGIGDKHIDRILEEIDVLVDGKFIKEQKTLEKSFVGSKNQRILHNLGRGEFIEENC